MTRSVATLSALGALHGIIHLICVATFEEAGTLSGASCSAALVEHPVLSRPSLVVRMPDFGRFHRSLSGGRLCLGSRARAKLGPLLPQRSLSDTCSPCGAWGPRAGALCLSLSCREHRAGGFAPLHRAQGAHAAASSSDGPAPIQAMPSTTVASRLGQDRPSVAPARGPSMRDEWGKGQGAARPRPQRVAVARQHRARDPTRVWSHSRKGLYTSPLLTPSPHSMHPASQGAPGAFDHVGTSLAGCIDIQHALTQLLSEVGFGRGGSATENVDARMPSNIHRCVDLSIAGASPSCLGGSAPAESRRRGFVLSRSSHSTSCESGPMASATGRGSGRGPAAAPHGWLAKLKRQPVLQALAMAKGVRRAQRNRSRDATAAKDAVEGTVTKVHEFCHLGAALDALARSLVESLRRRCEAARVAGFFPCGPTRGGSDGT